MLVGFVYVFLTSAGRFRLPWPTYNTWYDLLADGFRQGHLHLSISPSPELLAKPDPLAHENRALWAWDCLLFQREFYLYWGPFPALLQAAVKTVLRIRDVIGDQYLVFGFVYLTAVSGALLVDRMARRFFTRLPTFVVALAFLAFATANPGPYLVATPGTYQAAIVGGQAFTMVGLVFAFDAVWKASSGRTATSDLVCAGVAWAIALACRISVAPAVGLVLLVTVVATSARHERRVRSLISDSLAVGVPVSLGVAALLAYNKMRFGAWLDFGLKYQMETIQLELSARYAVATIHSYFLRTSELSCRFPFVIQHWDAGLRPMPPWMPVPQGWTEQEPIIGILVAVPTVWLAPVAIRAAIRCFLQASEASWPSHPARRITFAWLVVTLLIAGTFAGAADFVFPAVTMRYLADFAGPWVILGLLGAMLMVARSRGALWRRWGSRVLVSALTIGTIVVGLLLGFQGYNNQFERNNPTLYEKAVTSFSICR